MDKVIINPLERATSNDINDLQALQARSLADVLRWLGAERAYPSDAQTGGVGVTYSPETWVLGLEVVTIGNNYTVQRGVLGSAVPNNITLGALDSRTALGHVRDPISRSIPTANPTRTNGEWYLISARIAEVVTLNTLVEIFDIPTQTFIPVAKDKRVEFEVEFTETAGPAVPGQVTAGGFPALYAASENNGWTPLAAVKSYPNTANAEHGLLVDLRRDLRDVIRSAPRDPLQATRIEKMPPEILIRTLEGGKAPGAAGISTGFRGFFRATYQGYEYSFARPFYWTAQQTNLRVWSNELETINPNTLTHVYLVPYKSGVRRRVPSFAQQASGSTPNSQELLRGFLVMCQTACPPTRDGKNSANIRLPSTGAAGYFADLTDVEEYEAVHVFSAQLISAGQFLPFTITGNKLTYTGNGDTGDTNTGPVALLNEAMTGDGTKVVALPLANAIPPNARAVDLAIRITQGNTATGLQQFTIRAAKEDAKIGGTAALTSSLVLGATTILGCFANGTWWGTLRLPIHTPHMGDTIPENGYLSLAVELTNRTQSGETFGSANASIFVTGYDL